MDKEKISKFMSFALRHDPEEAGIEVDDYGWTGLSELVEAIQNEYNLSESELSKEDIIEVVQNGKKKNEKDRYEIYDRKIRANYGHSIDVSINNVIPNPPSLLYHGTPKSNIKSIKNEGLKPMNRNEVHLSRNKQDAIRVAKRHSNNIVLIKVNTSNLNQEVHKRNESVYTVSKVPPESLEFTD